MRERYDIDVTDDLYSRIRAQVRHGRASFLRKTNNRLFVFAVCVEDRIIPIVYDNRHQTLVTALPQRE